MFEAESIPIYQNFAVIGGAFMFLFIAVIAGLATKNFGVAIASGSLVAGVIEAYIYPEFAVIMFLILAVVVGLEILVAYLESRDSSGF